MSVAIIFDTELTDRKDGEIIEAAGLILKTEPDDRISLEVDDGFYSRYKPSKPITFGAMAVHHILPHELDNCPPSSEFALPADCAFLIGHSIDTDWQAAGSPAHVKRIDTHAIAQWLWPDATGYSQTALIYMLSGATNAVRERVQRAHSALDDCQLNYDLLSYILAAKPEITTWSQLWQYSEECRIPRTCPLKRWDGVLLTDMDTDAIEWCLRQHWLDPYFRIGLERVIEARYPNDRYTRRWDDEYEDDIEDDEEEELPPTAVSRYPNDVTNEAPAEDIGT